VALDTATSGIRVAMLTGGVDTPLARALSRAKPSLTPEDAWRAASATHPVGRMAHPEEIAALVAYLLSDETQFITGATFAIDGGMTARL
jgi:NAD(P)-dependent dehydrogenase (short-subunit alcohol dehydrogenase family)